MKKNLLIAAVLLSTMLAGCSKNELQEGSQNPDNAIQFAASAGKQTRGEVVDNVSIKDKAFGLYAYYTGQDNWATATKISVPAPNFMNNQEVRYSIGAWNYSPIKYWPNTSGDKLSFFGYWPKRNDYTSLKITPGELPVISFTQTVDEAESMTDLIVSHLLDQTKRSGNVVLPFKHVLTRLNFRAKVDRNLTDGGITGVFVTGLRILGTDDYGTSGNASGANDKSKFYANADYKLSSDDENGEWVYTNSQRVATPLNITPILNTTSASLGDYTSTSVPVDPTGLTMTKLLQKDQFLFLIPPGGKTGITSTTDIRVQVDYEIVTVDVNVPGRFVKTATSATVSLPNGALMEGKAYHITLTFGLSDIKLGTEVIDWDEFYVDAPSAIAISNSDANIIAAMEALNGIKAMNTTTNFTLKVTDVAPTAINLSNATALYNFEEGDQIVLAFTSGVPTTVTLPVGWTHKNVLGKVILVKESPRGWYMADMTGADKVTNITILDATTKKTDLSQLRQLLNGTTHTRGVSERTINLSMPYAKGIENYGFNGCTSLKTLAMPKVTELGDNVFDGCSNLTGLAIAWQVTMPIFPLGKNFFGNGITTLSNLRFITGWNTAMVNYIFNTWEVNGIIYTFQDVEIVDASDNVYDLLYSGH